MPETTAKIKTKARRITMTTTASLNKKIVEVCDTMGLAGYRLASSSVIADKYMVLIFQKTPF